MSRMHYLPLLVAGLLLTALPEHFVAAAETPAVPVPPEFALPSPAAQDAIIVANDADRFAGLERRGYRVYPDIAHALARVVDGGSIYITAGVYREDMFLYRLAGVELIGEEGVLVIADNDQDVCFMRECSGIRIHNVDMVHEIGESPCLHNCIVVWDCRDVLVEYCDLSGCGYIGVEVLGNGDPRSVRVEYCAIHDCEEAFYDVPGGVLARRGNVLWDNGDDPWNPTGWEEGEMFGSERQPHWLHDADYYGERPPAGNVPVAPEVKLPPPETPNLIVVSGDEMTEDHLAQQGYETSFSIQGAVDAAADGDTIYVTGGVYYENVVLESRCDLEIIGEEPVLVAGSFDMDVISLNRCRGIRFQNIDAVHDAGENCTQNCYAVFDSEDIELAYCDISGCGYVGIWVYGRDMPTGVRAVKCYIHDCEYAYVRHGEAWLEFFGTVVRGNAFREME